MPKAKSPDVPKADPTWTRPAYQNRSREQRDRLLKAGERAFAAAGFWQTHITDIAKRAGCSVGSFYRRFEDKEAFFLALQADMATRAEANIARFFEDPARQDESLSELMTTLARNTARTMRGIEGYYRALFELSLRGQDVWPSMRRIEAIEAEFVVKLLAQRGTPADQTIHKRAHLAIRMMHGQIVSAMLHGPGPWAADDPELHAELGLMLMRYLGVEDAGPAQTKTK